jgi:RNA polymerase sigma factor (sigma-70 family)
MVVAAAGASLTAFGRSRSIEPFRISSHFAFSTIWPAFMVWPRCTSNAKIGRDDSFACDDPVAKIGQIRFPEAGGTSGVPKSDVQKVERDTPRRASRGVVERAFTDWHMSLIRAIARQFGSGPPDPEEAVQAAFAKFAKLENPEVVDDKRAYLFMSARNYVLDYRRRAAVRSAAQSAVEILAEGDAPANLDIERVFIARERLAIIDSTLAAMEPRRREVMTLRIVEGLGYSAIAARMNLSESRVRQLAASALTLCTIALNAGDESEEA